MENQLRFLSSHLNLTVIGIFVFITLLVGLWAGRNVKTLKDYALANREFGAGVLTMTFLATNIHGNYIIAIAADFARDGCVAILDNIGPTVAFIWLALFVAPRITRFRDAITIGDISESMYGRPTKLLVGISGALYCLVIAIFPILVTGELLKSLLGVPESKAILMAAGVTILYASRGGIRSVSLTDVIQFVALIIVIAIMTNGLIVKIDGIQSIFKQLHAIKPQNFAITSHPSFKEYLFVGISNAIGIHLLAPPYIQRMAMAGSATKVKKMLLYSALFYTCLIVSLMLIGFASTVLYPSVKEREILPNLITNIFPVGIQGFIIAGILAINMSTSDSFIHSAGLLLVRDVIKPIKEQQGRTFSELKYMRYFIVLAGFCVLLLAYFYNLRTTQISLLYRYGAIALYASLIPIVLGILGFKPDKKAFLFSFLSYVAILLPLSLLGKTSVGIKVLAIGVSTTVFLITHFFINKGFVFIHSATGYHKTWQPSLSGFIKWLKNYFPTPTNVARYSELKVTQHGQNSLAFSIFLSVTYMLPYMLAHKGDLDLFNTVALVRTFGLLLCCGLMMKTLWSRKAQTKLFPLYWHLTLLYCLPFATTLIFLLGAGSSNWQAEIGLSIIMLIVLVDWISFLVIGSLGVIAAFGMYYALQGQMPFLPDFDTVYYLTVTSISTTIVGLVFARRKEIYSKIRFQTVTSLARFMGHEVNHLANYTVGPAQNIQFHLKHFTKPFENEDEKGYFLTENSYEQCFDSAKKIEKGSFLMTETAKQLAAIIQQYSNSLNNPEKISLQALIEEAIERYPGESYQKACISLNLKKNFFARIPKRALIFVIHNIIRNSFIHGRKEDLQVVVSVDNQLLRIRDNGSGIPAENLEAIFDMFFTTGDPRVSSGIGLGFAKLVVGWFNGKIWCESSQREGESFTETIIQFPNPSSSLNSNE